MALQNRFGVTVDTTRMVTEFMEMVRVDSESGDEARFMAWLMPRLEEIGASAGLDAYGNLIATLPPKNSTEAKMIVNTK